MTENFANLGLLLGGYFHQDWDLEGTTDADVILAFRRVGSADQVEATVLDVDQAIQFCVAYPLKADETLARLGCEYYYQADGLTGAAWLQRLRTLLLSPMPHVLDVSDGSDPID